MDIEERAELVRRLFSLMTAKLHDLQDQLRRHGQLVMPGDETRHGATTIDAEKLLGDPRSSVSGTANTFSGARGDKTARRGSRSRS
ncbi:hypothetical protein [Rhizorhabdus argentea]|uniref:hypothetical protein n=1 Tax=Rhizorhabdus argentea TaxID=1387174 RepID=UPI0030ECACF0